MQYVRYIWLHLLTVHLCLQETEYCKLRVFNSSRPIIFCFHYPVSHVTGIKPRVLEIWDCVNLTLRHCACVWVRLSAYWKCGVSLKFSPMATCCPRSEISSQLSRLKITINRYCIQCSPPTCATSPRPSVSNWLRLSKKGKIGLLDDYLFLVWLPCNMPGQLHTVVILPTNAGWTTFWAQFKKWFGYLTYV